MEYEEWVRIASLLQALQMVLSLYLKQGKM